MGKRGVRLNPQQDERTRAAIKTSQIVNRLTALVKGEVEMAPHAVTAALGLLRKTLPDLTAIEHSGEVETNKVLRAPEVQTDASVWLDKFADKPAPETIN